MTTQMDKKAQKIINKFIDKTFVNLEGQTVACIEKQDKTFMKVFLFRYWSAFKTLFKDERKALEIFGERLDILKAVRLTIYDGQEPLRTAYEHMKKDAGKIEGGSCEAVKEGLVILNPDMSLLTSDEGKHTLIHEITHAMTTNTDQNKKAGYLKYHMGISQLVYDRHFLNEGLTELIAQHLWDKMYKTKCPGRFYDKKGKVITGKGRYGANVATAQKILMAVSTDKHDREQVIEDFIVEPKTFIERMENATTTNSSRDLFSCYNFVLKRINSFSEKISTEIDKLNQALKQNPNNQTIIDTIEKKKEFKEFGIDKMKQQFYDRIGDYSPSKVVITSI